MREVTLSGSPYEIGYQYGLMLEQGGFEPPPVTEAQRQFAADCVPLVEDVAPRLLDELRGIADAGEWSDERIRAIPLALGWDAGCTVVALSGELTADGEPLFGRNYDFSTAFADYTTLFRTNPTTDMLTSAVRTIGSVVTTASTKPDSRLGIASFPTGASNRV